MNAYSHSPEVQRIIDEMNALNAVLRATTPELATEAQEKVRAILAHSPPPSTVPDFVLRTAMSKITNQEAPRETPKLSENAPWSTRAFELIGLAWLAWSHSDNLKAIDHIVEWADGSRHTEQWGPSLGTADMTKVNQEGAVQAYCVSLWGTAVAALLAGNMENARRYYRRVYDVGSSFGTESHPIILWTLAATFPPV